MLISAKSNDLHVLKLGYPQEIPIKAQNLLCMRKTKMYTRHCDETTVGCLAPTQASKEERRPATSCTLFLHTCIHKQIQKIYCAKLQVRACFVAQEKLDWLGLTLELDILTCTSTDYVVAEYCTKLELLCIKFTDSMRSSRIWVMVSPCACNLYQA